MPTARETRQPQLALADVEPGQKVRFERLGEEVELDSTTLRYLDDAGFIPGADGDGDQQGPGWLAPAQCRRHDARSRGRSVPAVVRRRPVTARSRPVALRSAAELPAGAIRGSVAAGHQEGQPCDGTATDIATTA